MEKPKNLDEAVKMIEGLEEQNNDLILEIQNLRKGKKDAPARKKNPDFKPKYKHSDKVKIEFLGGCPHHNEGDTTVTTSENATYFIREGYAKFVEVAE